MATEITIIEHVKSVGAVIIEHELKNADGRTVAWIVQVGEKSFAIDKGDFTAFEWVHLNFESALAAVRLMELEV